MDILRVGGACGPPPPVAAALASSLRVHPALAWAPSRGDPPLNLRAYTLRQALGPRTIVPASGHSVAPCPQGLDVPNDDGRQALAQSLAEPTCPQGKLSIATSYRPD